MALTERAIAEGKLENSWLFCTKASSRDLAKELNAGRANVIKAIDELTRRNIIAIHQGAGQTPAAYALQFLRVVPIGTKTSGIETRPLAAQQPLPVVSNQDHSHNSGIETRPLANIGTRAAARTDPDQSIDRIDLIDRALTAKASDFPTADLDHIRKWIQGYQAHLHPRSFTGEPGPPNQEPVPDEVCAAILTMTSIPEFERLIRSMAQDRIRPGFRWTWFVAVVAQRCHGISAAAVAERRKGLKLEKPAHQAIEGEQQTLTETDFPTPQELAEALARLKRMTGAK